MKLLKTEKFFASLVILFAFGVSNVSAVDSAVLAEVKESRRVFHRLSVDDKDVNLLPDSTYSDDTKNFVFNEISEKTGYAAECLYYATKSELIHRGSSEDKNNVDTSMKAMSKIVRSISKMKGMIYYSNTRKRYENLYTESYRIENPNSTVPVPDDLEGSSDGKTMYLYQEEHTFGKGFYEVNYLENKKVISMKLKNTSPLYFGIIKAVNPEKLKIVANIIDDGDGYYIYLGMCVDCINIAGMEKKMNKSFQARLNALYNWITYQF